MLWYMVAAILAVALGAFIARWLFKVMLMTYIGAETEDGAAAVLSKLLEAGFNVISDPLGEFTEDPARIPEIQGQYSEHVERLGNLARQFPVGRVAIAVKPSRLCNKTDETAISELIHLLRPIVERARSNGVFVWIDAEKRESLNTVEQTVMHLDDMGYYNVGLAVQAMHTRSDISAGELAERSIPIRVVKGAYADGDITNQANIDRNFIAICIAIAKSWPIEGRPQAALGTHDTGLIARVRKVCPQLQLEFQFLYGVRTAFQTWSLGHHERTVVYMPWGTFADAKGYFIRRLKEGVRLKTLIIFARNIFEARAFRKKYIE